MIILPDKTRKLSRSVMGMGAHVLNFLRTQQTVSSLWDKTRDMKSILTFEDFTLAADLLFALGLIEISEGIIRKTK